MLQAERFKLHGSYRTPKFKYGAVVQDLARGEVRIVGLTDARIPWPIGQKGRGKSLVLFKGLAKAVRKESHQAVRHWWGVGADRVWKWRKALGVPRTNPGTHKLRVRYGEEPFFKCAQRKAWSKARDPARRANIAAARLGKPRPQEGIAAMAAAKRGTRHTQESRRKMSLAHKELWKRAPLAQRRWSARDDGWLRTLPAAEVAKRTGRTMKAVWSRRRILGLPDGRAGRKLPTWFPGKWTAEEDELVRSLSVEAAVRKTRRTLTAVYSRRFELKSLERVDNSRRSAKMSRGG